MLLAGLAPEARRAALRAEMRRWHPDRFGARLGARLPPGGAELAALWARVNAVVESLTTAYRQLG